MSPSQKWRLKSWVCWDIRGGSTWYMSGTSRHYVKSCQWIIRKVYGIYLSRIHGWLWRFLAQALLRNTHAKWWVIQMTNNDIDQAKDCSRLREVVVFSHNLWAAPLTTLGCTLLLLYILGPTCLVGVCAIPVLIPVETWVARRWDHPTSKHLLYPDCDRAVYCLLSWRVLSPHNCPTNWKFPIFV